MNRSPLKLALLAGLGLSFAAALYAPPAAARTHVSLGIGINLAPPPPRLERVPPMRSGYVWAPGYWRWDGRVHRHVWVGGYWVRARAGQRYHRAHWMQDGSRWRFREGYWGH
jgi:hypothetical protein